MKPVSICGHQMSSDDLNLLKRIVEQHQKDNRTTISRELCKVFKWYQPNGKLKEMSCRVALLKLHRQGFIKLPEPTRKNGNGKKCIKHTSQGNPGKIINQPLKTLLPIEVSLVNNSPQSQLWNELVERYHYLGYKPLIGAQIRYLFRSSFGILGVIGFSAAAWKIASRDQWIGWSEPQRKKNLIYVVNNARFLVLPWIQCKNLASKLLSLSIKRLPYDWLSLYRYKPVLLETFVEQNRFRGTCYRAANWIRVGQTKGRGKLDCLHQHQLPIKEVFLYPLTKNFREILCSQ